MKKAKKIISAVLAVLTLGALSVTALAADGYGSAAVDEQSTYTLEQMLNLAIQDEYAARGEYELIIETFGEVRPYTNIIKAEERHIDALKKLFTVYGYTVPADESAEHTTVPASLLEAAKTGATVEENNTAMYEQFLKQDLADDVKAVFTLLKKASGYHLKAFQRRADRLEGTVTGNAGVRRGGSGSMTGGAGNGQTVCDGSCDMSGTGGSSGNGRRMSGGGQGSGTQQRLKDGSCMA